MNDYINKKNGSTKIWMLLPGPVRPGVVSWLREALNQVRPGLGDLEVYPDDPQFFLPLRPDKLTILDRECPRNFKDVYDPEYVLSYLQGHERLNAHLVISEIEKILAGLPVKAEPVHAQEADVARSARSARNVRRAKRPPLRATMIGDSFKIQFDALLFFCRIKGRVVSLPEALNYIKEKGLYSGDWADNEEKRKERVAWILRYIARTFDAAKARKGKGKKLPRLKWTTQLENAVAEFMRLARCDWDTAHKAMKNILSYMATNAENSWTWLETRLGWNGIRANPAKVGGIIRLFEDHGIIEMVREWHVDGRRYGRQYCVHCEFETEESTSQAEQPSEAEESTTQDRQPYLIGITTRVVIRGDETACEPAVRVVEGKFDTS
jgi:hypothetical protein